LTLLCTDYFISKGNKKKLDRFDDIVLCQHVNAIHVVDVLMRVPL